MKYQIKIFANLIIIFSIVLLTFIFLPVARQEISYQITKITSPVKNKYPDLPPKDTQFGIVIPKIKANSKVIINVDPGDKGEYMAALRKGVAHAKGTDFPGGKENIYLFAHSTDFDFNVFAFNAIFYLLHNLEKGDEVTLYYLGRRYNYYVFDKKIVNGEDVEYLTKKYGESVLTLQTCWPPGTTLQRLLVFAKPR
ncbi:sortase [Candidatus Microgenomates bacterium]|nr:sortase [Candidatus Microgenomates bacterium]